MTEFNAQEFGENIKKYRKIKGLKQENLARALNTTTATISRLENGKIIPNAKEINIICNELGIYESDLFERENTFSDKENSKNPFKTNKLYMYFNSYNPEKKKFQKDKWIININEKVDRCNVNLESSHTGEIISNGYLLSDIDVAFMVMQNHKPNRQRLDVCVIIINITEGIEKPMLGAYLGSNAEREPSIRKCYFSTKDIEFTDEMLENLKTRDYEMQKLKESYALYLDIFN